MNVDFWKWLERHGITNVTEARITFSVDDVPRMKIKRFAVDEEANELLEFFEHYRIVKD